MAQKIIGLLLLCSSVFAQINLEGGGGDGGSFDVDGRVGGGSDDDGNVDADTRIFDGNFLANAGSAFVGSFAGTAAANFLDDCNRRNNRRRGRRDAVVARLLKRSPQEEKLDPQARIICPQDIFNGGFNNNNNYNRVDCYRCNCRYNDCYNTCSKCRNNYNNNYNYNNNNNNYYNNRPYNNGPYRARGRDAAGASDDVPSDSGVSFTANA